MQNRRLKTYKNIVFPLLVGGISALLTKNGMKEFQNVKQPPLSPPSWLFPVAWTIFYLMMGYAYELYERSADNTDGRLWYYLQLFVNFFWSIVFFNFRWYLFAFAWLIFLLVLIVITAKQFYKAYPKAGWLMIPYALWVTFAGYLTLGVYMLNR